MSDLESRLAKLSPEKRALLEKRRQPAPEPSSPAAEPIAIIGMACRLPGGIETPDDFWSLVAGAGDAITEIPPDRWDASALYDPDPAASGRSVSRHSGLVRDIDAFDAGYFGISPREAARMDPQQRIFLEVAIDALDDAGQDVGALAGTDTGVFVGLHSHAADYFWFDVPHPERMDSFTGTGTSHNIVAGRLSYLFDFHGPALVVDTACSSSLVAIHLACQSLRAAECAMAVAGGVNLILSPTFTIALSRLGMLSPDGRCRAFDARANGFVRSEGCGVLTLKRLSDARKAGDRVHAVIRGSAVNQDGRTNGITAPNTQSQQRVITRALVNGGIDPSRVGYVEAHGTGTALGDPIEAEALMATVGAPGPARPCYIGSAKANIGHLEGAAGVAGVIKAVLSLRKRAIPPMAHFTALNPHISLEGSRLAIPTAMLDWESVGPRVAGVSSFGWSGTNAHLVIEEMAEEAVASGAIDTNDRPFVLPISARSDAALRQLATAYAARLDAATAPLAAVVRSAAIHRTHHDHRLAVAGQNREEVVAGLRACLSGAPRWTVASRRAIPGRQTPLVFVFSGQGPQWPGMGRDLLTASAVFREEVERVSAAFAALSGWSLVDEFRTPEDRSRLQHTEVAQPAIFALQAGLAAWWRSSGIEPAAAVGHSVGELAAAYVAGVLSLEDAVTVAYHRSRLMQRTTGRGRMVSVDLSVDEAQRIVAPYPAVSVAAHNGPASVVLSGDVAALDALVEVLKARGVACHPLPVNYAFHSPQMDAITGELRAALSGIVPGTPKFPLISTVSGKPAVSGDYGADYWVRNVRQPVRFADAVALLRGRGQRCFLEVSPHPVLASSIAQTSTEEDPNVSLPSLFRGRPESLSLSATLGSLYTLGVPIAWSRVSPSAARVDLPRYPWQRERYWLPETDARVAAPSRGANAYGLSSRAAASDAAPPQTGSDADVAHLLYDEQWIDMPRQEASAARAAGRWLVFADRAGLGASIAARIEAAGGSCTRILRGDDPSDIDRICGDLARSASIAGVVHLWSLDSAIDDAAASEPIERVLRPTYESVLQLTKAIVEGTGPAPALHVVTQCAQAPNIGGGRLPIGAALWGLLRVAVREHRGLRGGCIDLGADVIETSADQILGELCADTVEPGVAYQGGRRLVRRIVPLTTGSGRRMPVAIATNATYLVTGGLGTLGLRVAERLAARGARHLLLAGRRAPSAAAREVITALTASGVDVRTEQADVADPAVCATLLRTAGQAAPLRGVVHAAGVVDDGVLSHQTWDRFTTVMRPKVEGAWNLHLAALGQDLDFFVMFSSASALLGQPGQANYAAANALLDALAHERRALGLRATSIGWGPWQGSGMVGALDERTTARWAAQGILEMPVEIALDAMEASIASDRAQVAALRIDWSRFLKQFEVTPRDLSAVAPPPASSASGSQSLGQTLSAAPPVRRLAVLCEHIRGRAQQVLGLPDEHVLDVHEGLRDAGLDSLLAVELRNALQSDSGVALPVTIAFDYPTIDALARHLIEALGLALSATPADTLPPEPAHDQLDGLSEGDVEALLLAELDGIAAARNKPS